MSFIEIVGGKQIIGEINVQGSKNAVLPILAATVLVRGTTKINHCPKISDVYNMLYILEDIGCKIWWEESTVFVDAKYLTSITVPEKYVNQMRASITFLGSILGRMHNVSVSLPGGCSIGKRPIDLHLKSLRSMNITIDEVGDMLHCSTDKIIGTDIFLRSPSVGATENVILAAVLGNGVTRIFNAAMEPEVSELCIFLREAGAKIHGIGTDRIIIEGVKNLRTIEYTLSSDRIVAGTYMAMVACAGGDVVLNGVRSNDSLSVIQVLTQMGSNISYGDDYVRIISNKRPKAIPFIETKPYPYFPTDMQSQVMAALAVADGTSCIVENIFEARYATVEELRKFGANITTDGKAARIKGVQHLNPANVTAPDLRGGAALVIAGAIAKGITRIQDIQHIERGYEDICRDLRNINVQISRVETEG